MIFFSICFDGSKFFWLCLLKTQVNMVNLSFGCGMKMKLIGFASKLDRVAQLVADICPPNSTADTDTSPIRYDKPPNFSPLGIRS